MSVTTVLAKKDRALAERSTDELGQVLIHACRVRKSTEFQTEDWMRITQVISWVTEELVKRGEDGLADAILESEYGGVNA